MTTTGGVAKGILIFFCGYFLLIAMCQAASGQTTIAVFMFAGFTIPLSMVLHGYLKDRKTKKNLKSPAMANNITE
jgi:hypothetical protein